MSAASPDRASAPGALDQLLDAVERETATTLKVLHAFPADQSDLRPHPRSKTALELAWMFTMELKVSLAALEDRLDLSGGFPPAPESLQEVIDTFEQGREDYIRTLRQATEAALAGTVGFPTGPGQFGQWDKLDFLWFMLCDQIHHRGQFSVYLRMSGAKVPSIYGPTADEPWF
jgi:uncharacterized damage-inducible protein DinB